MRRIRPTPWLALVLALAACGEPPPDTELVADPDDAASFYVAEGTEQVGAAVAILLDQSGSMEDTPGHGEYQSKSYLARQAIRSVLAATDSLAASRPDFAVKVGLYTFTRRVQRVLPLAPYDSAALHRALDSLPHPSGGTAIGDAMFEARRDLYRAGLFRKYLIVVTDGENTNGRRPDRIGPEIHRRSQGAVQMYFVAFDTDPAKFGFLDELGGAVLGAGSGEELRQALSEIYEGRILAEADDFGETAAPATPTGETR
jgi:hypothetical protein